MAKTVRSSKKKEEKKPAKIQIDPADGKQAWQKDLKKDEFEHIKPKDYDEDMEEDTEEEDEQ